MFYPKQTKKPSKTLNPSLMYLIIPKAATFISISTVKIKLNTKLGKYLTNDQIMIVTFLDPESPSLPSDVSDGWTDLSQVYQFCRDFCWNIHAKREKNNSMQNHKKSIEETRK